MFTRNEAFIWRETIIDSGITTLFGLGAQIVSLDHDIVKALDI